MHGAQPEPELEHERQQEGDSPHPDPEQHPADHPVPQRRQLQEGEVDEGMRRAEGVPGVERDERGTEKAGGEGSLDRDEMTAARGEAEHQEREAEPEGQEPEDIERAPLLLADVSHEARRKQDPDDPHREIDDEDPAPVEIGGDEAAQRGADHRADERRHGHPGHRAHELAPGHAPQEDQPPHGHHHGPADSLQEPCGHEAGERASDRTRDRARHEDAERRPEDVPGTEAVGHPARDGNEHGQADQVRGQRELERDRVLVEVRGNRRESRREHGRVRVLHEQRCRDDDRDEAFATHQDGLAKNGRRGPGRRLCEPAGPAAQPGRARPIPA